MQSAFCYFPTHFPNAELDPGKGSCPDTLAALASVAAPLARGTPTRTLPDVPIFVEFRELSGIESVLR